MRKSIAIVCLLFLIIGCNDSVIKKPKNLIEKEKMINVLYDLSLLESMKSQNINGGISNKSASDYIYKKYKIDSLQFAKSNAYYASDYREYKKMYDALSDRLKKEKTAVDLIIKKEAKKEAALKKAKEKKVQDSIKKAKKIKELKIKKEKDSITKKKQEIKAKK